MKGLIAVREIYDSREKIDEAIIKGIDWILGCMTDEGRLVTPDTACWGSDDNTCSELIHMYCLSPIVDAGRIFGRTDYIEKAEKILKYYKDNYYDKIMNFSLLSHFYAYVMEALIDMGETGMAVEAMAKIADIQKHQAQSRHTKMSTGYVLQVCFNLRLSGSELATQSMETKLLNMRADCRMSQGDGMAVICQKIIAMSRMTTSREQRLAGRLNIFLMHYIIRMLQNSMSRHQIL